MRSAVEQLEARAYLSVDPLDPSFGSGGVAHFYSTGLSRNDAGGIFQLPSGKILVTGQSETPSGPGILALTVLRLGANGAVDTTFGNRGTSVAEVSGLQRVTAWAQQPDNKLVAVGKVGSFGAAMRLNPDGTLDSTFGVGGVATVSQLTGNGAEALVLDSAGRIILVGVAGNDMGIARLTSGGALDSAFGGGDGVTTVDITGRADSARAVVLQGDGRILVGGTTLGATSTLTDDFALTRLLSDGSLDTTFGNQGKINTDISDSSGSHNEKVNALAITADGKIIAAGETATQGFNAVVARYNIDGTLDTSFGSQGFLIATFASKSYGYATVQVLPDGSLLVGGNDATQVLRDFTIEKITPAGQYDASFGGGDGKLTFDFGSGSDWLHALTLQSDGKILAAGQATGSSDGSFLAAARANADGVADSSFGTNGMTQVAVAGWASTAVQSLAQAPDGRLVVGVTDNRNRLPVVRLTASGQLDPTFGDGGRASFGLLSIVNGDDRITTVAAAVAADGKVIAAGTQKNGGYGVGRYNADGTVDTTFGAGGLALGNTTSPGIVLQVESVVVQPDGKVLVSGRNGTFWAVTRLTATGSLDTSFGDGGSVRFDLAGIQASSIGGAHGLAVAADGTIAVVGQVVVPNDGTYLAVARLTAGGAMDTTFDSDGVRLLYKQPVTGAAASLRAVAVRPDGRIVAAGNESASDFVLYQLNPDGSPDSTFGTGGRVTTVFTESGNHFNTAVNALALRADGVLAAAGSAQFGAAARSASALYNSDGSLNGSYGVGGKILSADPSAASGIVFDSSNRVITAGGTTVAAAARYHLAPTVTINAANGIERSTPSTFPSFTFVRSGELSSPLTLSLTYGGTAIAGVDYQPLPSTVTFAAGASTAKIDVIPIDDLLLEGGETIIASFADAAGYVSVKSSATATLQDDEQVDAAEPNDTSAAATPFPQASGVSGLNASLHQPADVDYYSLVVSDGGLRASVTRLAGTGTLELDVFDAAQNLVGHSAANGSATQLVTLPTAGPGTYFIRVRGASDVTGYVAYNLAAESRRPYDATATAVTTSKEWVTSASRFDYGGEGISFHDTTDTNTGNSTFRNGYGVDLRSYKPTGSNATTTVVTDTRPGEWLGYTIDVTDAAAYTITTRAASLAAGSTFHYELDGAPLTGALALPVVADLNAPHLVSAAINLPSGRHLLRLVVDASSGTGSAGEFDLISLSPAVPSVQMKATGSLISREPEATSPPSPIVSFTVSRVGATDVALTVHYTVSGTMTAGDDYVAPSGDVVIPAGATTSAPVQVLINGDYRYEPTENLTVTLSPSPDYNVGPTGTLTWNVDDYRPTKTSYEPNETLATAAPTLSVQPTGTHIVDSLAPGDLDYYRCSPNGANGTMTATLNFASKYGDLYLVAYDASGNEIARSDTVGDSESITFSTGPVADYYFGVFGKDGASNGRYQLDLNWSETINPVAWFDPFEGGQYPVEIVPVRSNEVLYGLDLSDFRLTRDGVPVDFPGNDIVRLLGDSEGPKISGLSAVSSPGGKYVLTLVAAGSGVHDLYGNPLLNDATLTWINSAPMPTRTLPIVADAYTRGGTFAGANYGSALLLQAGGPSTGGDETREAFIRVDISSLNPERTESSAILRLFGSVANPAAAGASLVLMPVFDNGWTESGLTYSNRPPATGVPGYTVNIDSASGAWYQFDITSFLQQAKAAGATSIAFVLKSASGTTGTNYVNFNSSSAADHQPELLLNEHYVRVQAVFAADAVTVPEGGTAALSVRLNRAPTVPVTVDVWRLSSGGSDTDLDVQNSPLTFTAENWNIPQQFIFTARQDDDSVHGYANFAVGTNGVWQPGLAVSELDDDPALVTDVLNPGADLTLSDGTSTTRAISTSSTELVVRKSTTAGQSREAYVRFDLTKVASAADIQTAKVRLWGKTSASGSIPVGLFAVLNSSWSPTSALTWSTRPATASTPTASRTITGTTGAWYDFDVTAYIKQQKLAGAKAVSFALRGTSNTSISAVFNSNDATSNRPALNVVKKTVLPQQALIVSASRVSVKEGASANFTVKLATAPTSNVVVSIDRTGDGDLAASATTLTFTPTNWNTAQTVTIKAAQDADTAGGSADFTLSAPGLPLRVVTATEIDDDGLQPAVASLRAVADAYVRDGSYASTNFGAATDLTVRKSTTAGNSRYAYLKFDLATVTGVRSAKLRLFGKLSAAGSGAQVGVYSSTNTSWTSSGITWSNKPATGTGALKTLTVTGTTAAWYEVDLTSFVAAEKAAGHRYVTLVLKSATSEATVVFNSDNASANRPALVVS